MRFEFDAVKSEYNVRKHGIDFVAAQRIWLDSNRLEVPARTVDEPRFQIVGRIDSRVWSAFVTYRHEIIRIISVRRARPEERARYLGTGQSPEARRASRRR